MNKKALASVAAISAVATGLFIGAQLANDDTAVEKGYQQTVFSGYSDGKGNTLCLNPEMDHGDLGEMHLDPQVQCSLGL